MGKVLVALIVSVSAVALANANVPLTTAPEIDPSSAISAMTLLLGGLTVLRARIGKK